MVSLHAPMDSLKRESVVLDPQQHSDRAIPAAPAFLIGAAIGSGSTALAAERGGADFLLAINAGRLRSMGAPSIACMLPVFDAAALTRRFAGEELLPQCRIPVLLGVDVWGTAFDPQARAQAVKSAGFAGAVNFPSCMHYSHAMQQILARAGRGIEQEVAQLRAVQETGLTTMFYCATRTQARLAADAGIDMICLNLGWNVGGAMGHQQRESIEEVASAVREIGRLIKRINPATRFLLEGGPIATADDLGRLLALAPVDGYVGGSTIERMPLEVSVADQIDRFRHASQRRAVLDDDSEKLLNWGLGLGLIGRSKAQIAFLQQLKQLSTLHSPVRIDAEFGINTGPVVAALAGQGRQQPAILNIDVAGEDFPVRARSLLFGHRDSLAKRRPALADDELDAIVIHAPERLPAGTQRRLARSLRDGAFRPPGMRRSSRVVPRVILVMESSGTDTPTPAQAQAQAQVKAQAREQALAPELAAVFAGWELRVPPLRDRVDDLMELLGAATAAVQPSGGPSLTRQDFSTAALTLLQSHAWPGNDQELSAMVGSLLKGGAEDRPIQPDTLMPLLHTAAFPTGNRSERDRIVDALWRHGFNRTRTAAALGITRKTLYNKIQKYGLAG